MTSAWLHLLKSWSLHQSRGGSIAAILALVESAMKLLKSPNKAERIAAAKSLVSDLERLTSLLPVDQPLSDCISRRSPPVKAALNACLLERKAALVDPLQIVDRNFVSLKLAYAGNPPSDLMSALSSIREIAYEMRNNQVTVERWFGEGCAQNIAFVETIDTSRSTSIRCTISIQSYESFFSSIGRSSSEASPIVTKSKPLKAFNKFIIEGSDTTIDDYFRGMNNMLYSHLRNYTAVALHQLEQSIK